MVPRVSARKTHCPRGHEYTPENTWAHPRYGTGHNAGRECKECRRVRHREYGRKRQYPGAASEKLCERCGRVFRRSDKQYIMANGQWASMRFCGEGCRKAALVDAKTIDGPWFGRLRRVYGVSREQWQMMREYKDGLCPICEKRQAICVDHNHETGQTRALLCRRCNAALGIWEENISILERAVAYLSTHQRIGLDQVVASLA